MKAISNTTKRDVRSRTNKISIHPKATKKIDFNYVHKKTNKIMRIKQKGIFRKGQGMEMMGLMIIVILLIVLGAIYLRFASQPKPNIIEEATVDLQNSMLLNALAKTTLCKDTLVEDAVKACARNAKACGADGCLELEEKLPKLLQAALGREIDAKRYDFAISFSNAPNKKIEFGKASCAGRGYFTKTHQIWFFPGSASMKIGRCS